SLRVCNTVRNLTTSEVIVRYDSSSPSTRCRSNRASHLARSLRGDAVACVSRSRPGHDLDRRRARRIHALACAGDVWRSDMDAEEHGAACDLALQPLGAFVW